MSNSMNIHDVTSIKISDGETQEGYVWRDIIIKSAKGQEMRITAHPREAGKAPLVTIKCVKGDVVDLW